MSSSGEHQLRQVTREDIEFLADLQNEMNTQPHLCQADPRFLVIMDYEYRKAGEDDDVTRICVLSDDSAIEYFDVPSMLLAAYQDARDLYDDEGVADWLDHYGLKRIESEDGTCKIEWEYGCGTSYELEKVCEYYTSSRCYTFILEAKYRVIAQNTMFLTLAEAKAHLKANYYHYDTEAHTYAMTAWRSPQVEQLYKILHEVDFDKLLGVFGDDWNG